MKSAEQAVSSFDLLIYDSGVGGLSIAQEIHSQLPALSQLYLSDNAAFPYGTKEPDWLVHRVESVIQQLLRRWQVKLIVMACNTASTIVLPSLRQQLQLPVVGVVPAIKPAAKISRLKRIALIATPATIQRPYSSELIKNFAEDCQVIRIGSSRLVEMAEEKLRGKALAADELRQIMAPLFADQRELVDVAVLGCTHFPLLKPELETYVSRKIHWIDSGAAIARRVQELAAANKLSQIASQKIGHKQALFTQNGPDLRHLEAALQSLGFPSIEIMACPV